jgi:hypothetical protein
MKVTQQVTRETYRGVTIEVIHPHDKGSLGYKTMYGWCGYVYLELDQVADKKLRKSLWPKPTPLGFGGRMMTRAPDWLNELDFHGGVTYFCKQLGPADGRGVKVGCDYRHFGDEDELYDVDSVLCDMHHVVDRLHERTTYLMRCWGDGRLAPESEGTIPEGWEQWASYAYMAESEWFQKHHTKDGKKRTEEDE